MVRPVAARRRGPCARSRAPCEPSDRPARGGRDDAATTGGPRAGPTQWAQRARARRAPATQRPRGERARRACDPAFLRRRGTAPGRRRACGLPPCRPQSRCRRGHSTPARRKTVTHHAPARHPEWMPLCLAHTADVLAAPEHLGYRPERDARRVEFVRRVGPERRLLLVAVKFLDHRNEAWVSTAYPLKARYLTRPLRAGTMREVARGQ